MMDTKSEKCVIIIDEAQPLGVMANITSILSISLGKLRPDIVGNDMMDSDKHNHFGLIQVPVPVLKASCEKIKSIRNLIFEEEYSEIDCIDFSNVAQECMTYEDYTSTMQTSSNDDLIYMGIALVGNKKKINKLSGNLPLLR